MMDIFAGGVIILTIAVLVGLRALRKKDPEQDQKT